MSKWSCWKSIVVPRGPCGLFRQSFDKFFSQNWDTNQRAQMFFWTNSFFWIVFGRAAEFGADQKSHIAGLVAAVGLRSPPPPTDIYIGLCFFCGHLWPRCWWAPLFSEIQMHVSDLKWLFHSEFWKPRFLFGVAWLVLCRKCTETLTERKFTLWDDATHCLQCIQEESKKIPPVPFYS